MGRTKHYIYRKNYTLQIWEELSITNTRRTKNEKGSMRGSRVVIPRPLESQSLDELHMDHSGVVRSKAIARTFVWCSSIDKQFEEKVRSCSSCSEQRNDPPPERMQPWDYSQYAWQRLHTDFADPFLNHTFLVIIEAYSKWEEVILVRSMNVNVTIGAIIPIFATCVIPEHVVADNGGSFTSEKWKRFVS